jgi:hypothetical protein
MVSLIYAENWQAIKKGASNAIITAAMMLGSAFSNFCFVHFLN